LASEAPFAAAVAYMRAAATRDGLPQLFCSQHPRFGQHCARLWVWVLVALVSALSAPLEEGGSVLCDTITPGEYPTRAAVSCVS
jgi:hypothetical protein